MKASELASIKADELLKLGDSLSITNPAESRRVLRKCRRYRIKAKLLAKSGD